MDSARATKIKALPMILESSLNAPKAELAAEATAIPAPIHERPVDNAAAMYLQPSAPVAAVASEVAALTEPPNNIISATISVPKKNRALKPNAALKFPFFFSPNRKIPNGTTMLNRRIMDKITFQLHDLYFRQIQ